MGLVVVLNILKYVLNKGSAEPCTARVCEGTLEISVTGLEIFVTFLEIFVTKPLPAGRFL